MQKNLTCPLLFTIIMLLAGCGSATLDDPVSIENGLVSGVYNEGSGVWTFKGIPYAAPPTGDMRWRPPQPAAQWEGIRKADQFSSSCIQDVAGERLPWSKEFMVQDEISEDCLCLNIWTAAKTDTDGLPVLVYIHGGGYTEGSGSVAIYDGEELARKGLVVVTINYRLGVLGFLAHPELTAESEHNASGNYGLLDVVESLKWIQNNISAFGGDPSRVAIAGQSAGASAVHHMTASPLAKGLFHGAIPQSGSSVGRPGRKLADAEADGAKFAESKGASSIKELRAMSVDELTATDGQTRMRFGAIIDGWLLPEDITEIFAKGLQNDVPTMTGMTADERSSSPTYGKIKAEEFVKQARKLYGDQADAFLMLYPRDTQEQSGDSQKQSSREQGMVSMYLWAANRAKTAETPAYTYYLSHGIPWPEHPEFAAFHTSDVPYIFNNLNLLDRPWEETDRALAETMSSYWVNFAATGDPNGEGLPQWPAFDTSKIVTMELGEETGPRPIADKDKFDFFVQYLTKPRTQ